MFAENWPGPARPGKLSAWHFFDTKFTAWPSPFRLGQALPYPFLGISYVALQDISITKLYIVVHPHQSVLLGVLLQASHNIQLNVMLM